MDEKVKHCVFIDPRFLEIHSNLKYWVRDNNIFDCISVQDLNHYLHVVAVFQLHPDINHNLDIWIPTAFVQLVVWNGYDKLQIGFESPETKDNNNPDQPDQT
jgi:hypothetical protein